jgi:hypothetical protein
MDDLVMFGHLNEKDALLGIRCFIPGIASLIKLKGQLRTGGVRGSQLNLECPIDTEANRPARVQIGSTRSSQACSGRRCDGVNFKLVNDSNDPSHLALVRARKISSICRLTDNVLALDSVAPYNLIMISSNF